MITVRPAQAHELDDVTRIWMDGWTSTGLRTALDEPFAALRERVDLELAHGWELFVAQQDAAIVGMLALKPGENRLDQLFVDPPAQGRGVGRALMAFAKSRLPGGIWLRTAIQNARAKAWYEREGFVLDRTEPHPTFPRVNAYYRWGSPG